MSESARVENIAKRPYVTALVQASHRLKDNAHRVDMYVSVMSDGTRQVHWALLNDARGPLFEEILEETDDAAAMLVLIAKYEGAQDDRSLVAIIENAGRAARGLL